MQKLFFSALARSISRVSCCFLLGLEFGFRSVFFSLEARGFGSSLRSLLFLTSFLFSLLRFASLPGFFASFGDFLPFSSTLQHFRIIWTRLCFELLDNALSCVPSGCLPV